MSRKCDITGTGVQAGNNVSHSNRKSRRRFLPNLQNVTLMSDILQSKVKLRITSHTLRSIEINGGIDAYILSTANANLAKEGLVLKRRLKKALLKQQEQKAS